MATFETKKIDTMAKANRYMAELTPSLGAANAIQRVQDKSTEAVAQELGRLQRYIAGDTGELEGNRLSIFGIFLKHVADRSRASAGITVINQSLADARRFADSVRTGLPGDLYYSVAVLVLLIVIAILWLFSIAPAFSLLYSSYESQLPSFSQAVLDTPWIFLLPIGAFAVVLALLIFGTRRVAVAIDTMMPLTPQWLTLVCGNEVARSHERWRVATLASAWNESGSEPLAAIRAAADKLNVGAQSMADLLGAVQLADELGLAKHELEFQRQQRFGKYQEAMESRRAIVARTMQLISAVLVGAVVVAIYLPIFQMGSVV